MMLLSLLTLADVTDTGLIVDLANLQAWQVIVGLVGVLGLSPAPWILGLALGRIQFSGPAQREADARVSDLKEQHARELASQAAYHAGIITAKDDRYADLLESRDGYKAATVIERERAAKLADALSEYSAMGKLVVHTIKSLQQAASEEVTPT